MSMILRYKNQNKTTLDFWKSIKVNIKRETQGKKEYLYKVFLNCYEMSHGFWFRVTRITNVNRS